MTKQYELLPCLCCDSEAELNLGIDTYMTKEGFSRDRIAYVMCKKCGLRTRQIRVLNNDTTGATMQAISLWNHRKPRIRDYAPRKERVKARQITALEFVDQAEGEKTSEAGDWIVVGADDKKCIIPDSVFQWIFEEV